MNDTSVGFVSPFPVSLSLQVMALLFMAIWQIRLQNMADVGYHIIGTDIPHNRPIIILEVVIFKI